jgi:hypothetical protein
MKLIKMTAFTALILLVTATAPAFGNTITYNILLSGSQSVPVNITTASGTATVIVDDVLNTVQVNMTFTGLIGGNASAAHIHCCVATNANGPIVIPFTGFPAATSGTYSNTFPGVSAANIAGIEAGLAYINIHNAVFPGGEIRGNILAAVPEPASFSLMALGVLAVLALRLRGPFASHSLRQDS